MPDINVGIGFFTNDAATRSCSKGAVVNMSLGGRKNNPQVKPNVTTGVGSGLFLAVSADKGVDAKYISPASDPSVCTVGATSVNDVMPRWSNHGGLIDVLTSGANITSFKNNSVTAMYDGTSMATPHV